LSCRSNPPDIRFVKYMIQRPKTKAVIRLLCAIAISPIVPGVLLSIIVATWKESSPSQLWFNVSAIVGYPSLIVLGLPLCYLLLRRGWLRLWHFIALGGMAGFLAFFMLDIVVVGLAAFSKPGAGHGHSDLETTIRYLLDDFVSFVQEYGFLLPVFAVSGMVAALCFWAITRPSFPVWRHIVQRKAAG